MNENHFKLACEFTIKLARIAHKCGTQSRRLELYLLDVMKSFGYDGVFRVNPNEISLNFIKDNEVDQITHSIYMEKTGFNLVMIDQLADLVSSLRAKKITLEEANASLDEISNSNPRVYGIYFTAFGYALASFGFAGFLGCSLTDLILSALLGILVYVICFSDRWIRQYRYALPFLCSLIIGLISASVSIILSGINVYLIALSALIYLIPGFMITCGIIEISYQYVLSGLINLVNGLVTLIVLFFGVFIGVVIIKHFMPISTLNVPHINPYLIWPLAILMAAGFCIIFQVPKKYFGWAMASVIFVCVGIFLGRVIGDLNIGNLLGSIFAVLFANFWTDKYHNPTSIVLIPSVVFLVSGSIGFRGFIALSADNIHIGMHDVIQMFVVAIMIAIGLGIGNGIYKVRISL